MVGKAIITLLVLAGVSAMIYGATQLGDGTTDKQRGQQRQLEHDVKCAHDRLADGCQPR